ncbi:MAG: relaxase/mobilization nuclease domain-containing protein [Streptococcus salivarius]|nr:relaxase/mobilization nuclease domain-containing protein [Streptococcus salivarius]
MPITKVLQIKKTENLKRSINYITQDAKTLKAETNTSEQDLFPMELIDGTLCKRLVSGHNLTDDSDAEIIFDDFVLMKESADIFNGRSGLNAYQSDLHDPKKVLAHHIIQSFSPDDNLTPEEVHEIGRKTVMELTGGQYQFVIATHLDKGHLHNHIILNTTNSVTLKKFQWKKNTKQTLAAISDKYAEIAGAKVIEPKLNNSYTKYSAWRRKNVYKVEIKERLDFLLRHSLSLDDFKEKAKRLNVTVDFSGKYVKYRLDDKGQQKFTRDRTLSKKGKYSLEEIKKALAKNEVVYSKEDVSAMYQEEQEQKEEDFEYKLDLEEWQVDEVTSQGIFVTVDFGIDQKGQIKIPARMLDQNEDGTFTAYVKQKDFFYFLNPDHSNQNRYITGGTVMKQLSQKSGDLLLKKNRYISKLDRLVDELNFLSDNNVTNSQQYEDLENKLLEQLEETDFELNRLDDRLSEANKIIGALSTYQGQLANVEVAEEILEKNHIDKNTDPYQMKKILEEVQLERTALKEKRDTVVSNLTKYKTIEQEKQQQKQNKETKQQL